MLQNDMFVSFVELGLSLREPDPGENKLIKMEMIKSEFDATTSS